MKFEINEDMFYTKWDKELIETKAVELDLTILETMFYLYFFNTISVSPEDRGEDFGREMYRKFAKATRELLTIGEAYCIEKQFYETFDINPVSIAEYGSTFFPESKFLEIGGKYYPRITDSIILDLICYIQTNTGKHMYVGHGDKETLRREVILCCCNIVDNSSDVFLKNMLKKFIRKLFKGN